MAGVVGADRQRYAGRLERVALEILDDHVKHCVAGALAFGDATDKQAKNDELLAALRRFAKTR